MPAVKGPTVADNTRMWTLIHAERKTLADTIETFTPEQWAQPSLCEKWTVGALAAHVVAGAEQTPPKFIKGLLTSGLSFNRSVEKTAASLSTSSKEQIVTRLRQRLTTTNRPPAPPVAMLGEAVVHGEDMRRPLGLTQSVSSEAINECLAMYTKSSFPVGGKKRIAGLRLTATDTGWSYGDGAEVSGPGLSILLAMNGRPAGLTDLSGDGVATLASRM